MGAYAICGPQEQFKNFVYLRGNQFSNSIQMAEIGVKLGPLRGSIL